MQFKFLAAFFLLGACVAQASEVHLRTLNPEIQRGWVDDAVNKAKEAIEKLKTMLQEKISESMQFFDNMKDQINNLVQGAIEGAKESVNELIKDSMKQIEEIKQKADEAGADIGECIESNQDQFQQLFEKFLADELHCVTGEIEHILQIIDDGVKIITDAVAAVQELPAKLAACGTSLSSLGCIAGVTADAVKMGMNIPVQVSKKVAETTQLFATLKERLAKCAITQLANAGIGAAKIVGDVAKCSADKINGQ